MREALIVSGARELRHRDRLALQHLDQRPEIRRVGLEQVRVLPRRHLLAHHLVGVLQQPFAIFRRRAQRGHRGRVVARDAVGQRVDRAVVAHDGRSGAAVAGHFVRHADRAVQRRPGVAVAGIEEVELFARKERPSLFRERLGIGAAEFLQPRIDVLRQVRVDRPRVGREKVRRLVAHLVEVDEDLRIPLRVLGHARAHFALRRPGPVAVHVDQVVIEAAARPRLVVLEGVGIRIGLLAARADEPRDVALAAVGIEQRIDEDDEVVEQRRGIRIGEQRVRHFHRHFRGRRLVAVHAEGEPGDGGRALGDLVRARLRGRIRIGERGHVRADRIERGAILRRRDHGQHQRAMLVRFAELLHRDQIRPRRQQVEVVEDARVRREAVAEFVAEKFVRRGDGSLGLRRGGDKQNEYAEKESSHHVEANEPQRHKEHRAFVTFVSLWWINSGACSPS